MAENITDTFQARVAPWMQECFGAEISADVRERGDRFLEEALEFLQAHGYDRSRIPTLTDYVYGRPVGEPHQEAGGVMVTFAAYCLAVGLDMHQAGEDELARISEPAAVEKIRAKQASKRGLHTPLPVPSGAPVARERGITVGLSWPRPATPCDLVPRWEGEFYSHGDWVNFATNRLTVATDSNGHILSAICVDAFGRRCNNGRDMARARDENAFPVRYFWDCWPASQASDESCGRAVDGGE